MPKTCIYKEVDGLQLRVEAWGARTGSQRPVVLWAHGGALILGSRKSILPGFQDPLVKRGYTVVSLDYRLAPETKLAAVIEDLQDAYRWLHREGPHELGIDPERIAVAGASAGGYLTQMSGFCVEPRPRALISYYGYGEITTPWYAEPDPFYCQQPIVSREEAESAVGTTPLCEPPTPNERFRFYLYCRQQGRWPQEVADHDPRQDPRWFDRYCPYRNVTPEYPPTLLIHGTADTDVPYADSAMMAERLEEQGVPHELVTLEGAGHGLSDVSPQEVKAAHAKAHAFLQQYL